MIQITESYKGKVISYLEVPDDFKREDWEVFCAMVDAVIAKRLEQKQTEENEK